MKIIKKDNFGRDLFTEQVVAENVNEVIGEQLVKDGMIGTGINNLNTI